jgi:hypothetical protein
MSIATYDFALATLGAISQKGAWRGLSVPVNTAQPGTILKSGHSNRCRRMAKGGGLAVPIESIMPFSPSMAAREALASEAGRLTPIDGCAAA